MVCRTSRRFLVDTQEAVGETKISEIIRGSQMGGGLDLDLAGTAVSGRAEGHLKLRKPRRKWLKMNFGWDTPEN